MFMTAPTVYEVAEQIIARNQRRIEELQMEIASAKKRLKNPDFAYMFEAERIATNSEPMQRYQFPETGTTNSGPTVDCDNPQQLIVDNQLHREDGPTHILPDGTQEWWENGVMIVK